VCIHEYVIVVTQGQCGTVRHKMCTSELLEESARCICNLIFVTAIAFTDDMRQRTSTSEMCQEILQTSTLI
jgi:hypothetical protein